MGKLKRALGAAKAAAVQFNSRESTPKGERHRVAGRVATCQHCDGDRFETNTIVLLGFTVLQCVKCSAIQWFAKPPEPIDD